ncbi:MAG: hypothetical protein Q9220_007443 [cf. Caloplaca sp. 1 TL-2023]
MSASNSWARKNTQAQAKTPKATNRDRYETKPMPPTPEPSPSRIEKPLTARKKLGYVQPATPLTAPILALPRPKTRAATDPVMPRPLFTSKTSTVNQLCKMHSQPKEDKVKSEGREAAYRSASPPAGLSHKASQILGFDPSQDGQRGEHLGSAPPFTNLPDPFHVSTGSISGQSASTDRQVRSMPLPVPTRRYLQENNVFITSVTNTVQKPGEEPPTLVKAALELQANKEAGGDDRLPNPDRCGTYDKRGEIEYVSRHPMQRVSSFTGLVESLDASKQDSTTTSNSATIEWDGSSLCPENSDELLRPIAYTSDSFGGVWENDPDVGRTLPPFSPFDPHGPPYPSSEMIQRAASQASRDVPMILQRFPGEPSNGSGFTHSLRSQNSWAPSTNVGSSSQADPILSAADTTPRFPTHTRNNSVPPPPPSYPGFQASGPLPPNLVQMELNLHHHIDACFGSLMRLMVDNTDRTIDTLLRRTEDSQDFLDDGFKSLKYEIKDMKKELGRIRKELVDVPLEQDKFTDSIVSLGQKLAPFGGHSGKIGSHDHQATRAVAGHGQEMPPLCACGNDSPHRRSESVNTSTSSHQHQRLPCGKDAVQASMSSHSSYSSSRCRNSNTASSGNLSRKSDERSVKRDILTQLGTVSGPVPDIREHPAFQQMAESEGKSSSNFQTPDYGEIWYQQVHGSRHQKMP